MTAEWVAHATPDEVLACVGGTAEGLSDAEAAARLRRHGPNAVRSHHVSALAVLGRQLRSALLILLAGTAVLSYFLGDSTQAIIIGGILLASIGLGFTNEYRAERMAARLHSSLRHTAMARRDGRYQTVDVTEIVPGDVIRLALGEVVPADVRLLDVSGLECDEGILTGESSAAQKSPENTRAVVALGDSTDLAFMGTIVTAGQGVGVAYATGARAQFGRIAVGLGTRQPETAFQVGLRRFSYLLLWVALTLTAVILVSNLLLRRPVIESVLFALAIAVGMTPQLLPAVISTSLAAGAGRLAKLKVLVKRLVCIEDLGDIDVLITDKTGTLTDGHVTMVDAVDAAGRSADRVLRLGLLATAVDSMTVGEAVNALDAALWEAPRAGDLLIDRPPLVASLPFDHSRRASSVLVGHDSRRVLIVKGAPEQVLDNCVGLPAAANSTIEALFADGRRVVAVASKPAAGLSGITTDDESDLTLHGFLVFADEPKAAARESLTRLAALGIEVKVATGDNPRVAEKVCAEIGLASKGTVTGVELDRLADDAFDDRVRNCTIFARISRSRRHG